MMTMSYCPQLLHSCICLCNGSLDVHAHMQHCLPNKTCMTWCVPTRSWHGATSPDPVLKCADTMWFKMLMSFWPVLWKEMNTLAPINTMASPLPHFFPYQEGLRSTLLGRCSWDHTQNTTTLATATWQSTTKSYNNDHWVTHSHGFRCVGQRSWFQSQRP